MRHLFLATILIATPALAQYAPGLSPSERQQGAQASKELVQQFGGAMSGPLADYVTRVGKRVAVQSNPRTRPEDYTVTLLNSTVPNAFATPGGFIYVTRGLLAIMNSEAELASVMGHEVGHVAAQHSQSRNTRAGVGGLLAGLAGAITGSDLVGTLANYGAGAYVAGFSRSQENEADALGMRYSAAAGYDPFATPSMLAALARENASSGQGEARGISSWFSTHPVTTDRVRRTQALAQKTGIAPGTRPVNRDAFLNAIDGMPFGDSADQGVVQGSSFRHPGLRLAFDAPSGFRLNNGTQAVTGESSSGANFVFAGAPAANPEDSVRQTWAGMLNGQVPDAQTRRTTINGLDAALSSARLNTNRGTVDVGIAAYRFGEQNFVIRTIAPAGDGGQFDRLVNSFRRLSPAEAGSVRTRIIDVVTVKPGETVQSLAARMAVSDNPVARFTNLNGIERVRPGDRVKLIVWK
ncbi:M48 family metalloprotease [Sandaracinobacteroides saxicola]|uniref:M48 family metalloprotease n=1 Tax=Sandaracinobacteroides saxicola TaxID=2759707 RepID=A0A7G5IGA3_9SPHN|nr:M48 family metalloprotease [Sandaracinobacteroides saxicola]QMW22395.1 M48 family metalloprotease [Sandaracinobacteroides saxicola]